MEQQTQPVRLKLPEQDLPHLTIGADQPKKLQQWVDELPIMNMGETARQLYQFIQELNRLQIDSRQRLQLLEVVRPSIDHVSHTLEKHYLNQSLVLPEKARRVASLAQALQGHLANGYKLVAVRGVRKIRDKAVRRSVAMAIQRALAALGDTLLRCYQLYFPSPRNLWLELHQLYLLAEVHGLTHLELGDKQQQDEPDIAACYIRCLLLATAKPNQLRQQELAMLYRAGANWASLVEIKTAGDNDDLFVFDLQADRPPIYRTHSSQASENCRYIDAVRLVEALSAWQRDPGSSTLAVPSGINASLVSHLQQVWGALTERAFKRMPESGEMELCFGLGAVHYFLAGRTPFESMVERGELSVLTHEQENNPFLTNIKNSQRSKQHKDDPWASAYRTEFAGETIDMSKPPTVTGKDNSLPESHHCQKVNASPGGYCLSWQGNTPSLLRTGELLALRDHPDSQWALAVVRWVTQLANHGARFGVELLAPGARPIAARLLKKQGENSDFMRCLLLPELAAVGQPATLLLPTVGFAEGAKVELVDAGESRKVQLLRRWQGASGFSQYPFRELVTATSQPQDNNDDGELDSIWSSL
ncbi:hypothetical protein A11A3_00665 [Alcanivorax hongdengensis A-11-3]|uniref:Molecular chaperone n=1 Tax=Alcanivorax hongdengensis A-11-3 TaxID=1177179 RepID=L0WG34_9GAMM|nr:hypothetical protein [Alcanivorax hongdengensis]EKF75961.1 hypothetical protein A11A3_00665 [Alcanivorax hongdengensis A-11-3]